MIQQQPQRGSRPICPICKKAVTEEAETFPFCSERCKTIDLGKWSSGDYCISRPINKTDLEEV